MMLSPTLSTAASRTSRLSTNMNDRAKKSVSDITKILTSVFGDADKAIKQKVLDLGGAPGKALGGVEFGAGDGFRQKFEHGEIFLLPPNAPCWVHGAILAEYAALGAEGGFLGYPVTDERPTPDGAGRYNHFQNGSIYWSYASGAHEVHGAIRDKWASLGWEQGWLGFPMEGERPFTEGGRISRFQNGAIYWWPDIGAFDLGRVRLRYRGLYCFGESNEASSADEPYVVIGSISVPADGNSPPAAMRSPIYDDVDSGDERPDDIQIYVGNPFGMALGVALIEHDQGDPDAYLGLVKAGVDLAGKGVSAACGALFGPEAAPTCESLWKEFAPKIVSTVNDIIGSDDDLIGKTTLQISAKEMVQSAHLPWARFWGIRYHLETELLTDGDASYKVYFSVDPV
jgi:hypothetical protein